MLTLLASLPREEERRQPDGAPNSRGNKMETYPIRDANLGDRPFAFEVENAYITARTIAHLLSHIDGVADVRSRKLLRGPADVHVEFRYRDRDYMVWEPYGDNSRYWIGPKETTRSPEDISDIERVFRGYRPRPYRYALGDVLSFKWISRLWHRSGQRL